MTDTEAAAFASLVQDAETFPEAVAAVKARDERIRNAALDEAAQKAESFGRTATTFGEVVAARAFESIARELRAMKVTHE